MESEINSLKLIDSICEAYQLGDCISPLTPCQGGLQHHIYHLHTTKGQFIIKRLNPRIINQPHCKERYRTTEHIAHELKKHIPAICALTYQDDPLFTFENEVIMLFPYIQGRTLHQNEITNQHLEKIACSLAYIHQSNIKIDHAQAVELPPIKFIPIKKPIIHSEISKQLNTCLSILTDICEYCENNKMTLKTNTIISHRDLDPKNVLWSKDHHDIIDWESAGIINKTKDLLATAIYWSLNNQFRVNLNYLTTFLITYQKNEGIIYHDEIETGLYGLLGDWVAWLEFNLSRIINHPEGSDEYILGMNESKQTLTAIPILFKQFPELIKVIRDGRNAQ